MQSIKSLEICLTTWTDKFTILITCSSINKHCKHTLFFNHSRAHPFIVHPSYVSPKDSSPLHHPAYPTSTSQPQQNSPSTTNNFLQASKDTKVERKGTCMAQCGLGLDRCRAYLHQDNTNHFHPNWSPPSLPLHYHLNLQQAQTISLPATKISLRSL